MFDNLPPEVASKEMAKSAIIVMAHATMAGLIILLAAALALLF